MHTRGKPFIPPTQRHAPDTFPCLLLWFLQLSVRYRHCTFLLLLAGSLCPSAHRGQFFSGQMAASSRCQLRPWGVRDKASGSLAPASCPCSSGSLAGTGQTYYQHRPTAKPRLKAGSRHGQAVRGGEVEMSRRGPPCVGDGRTGRPPRQKTQEACSVGR